jgi:DNA helicase-2/ATP-dependent DNA helicase PcrA
MMPETGYFDMLDAGEEKDRVTNIYDLASQAGRAHEEIEQSLKDFVRELSLVSDSDNVDDDNTVKLMTVHTAKGLEYPVVFVVGLEENIFPHFLSIQEEENDPNQLEEERRSFYVAMTRAEKRLFLTNAKSRTFFGKKIENRPSRFLTEIPKMFLKNA